MTKKFVLDTNVLLHDPTAIESFKGKEVIIPIYAIEEIDRFKRELSERGRNARLFSRYLDHLRKEGSLAAGVRTESGGLLRVAFLDLDDDVHAEQRSAKGADDLILAVALQEQVKAPDAAVVVVTRDVNLRIRADARKLQAVDYHDEHVDITELYTGTAECDVNGDLVDKLYADGSIDYSAQAYANQCFLVRNQANSGHAALARYNAAEKRLVASPRFKSGVWGIRPRNKEQHFALDLLMDDSIKLVTLIGKAGTGKTLLAIAAGLQRSLEDHSFQKLLVSRPIFPLGRDIGFLPGDVEEKLNPWMQPIYDNLELLLGITHSDDKDRSYRDFINLGYVEVEPLTYIRGRSIPNQFMIVDEAQNLTPLEAKTILTRAGESTKIVFTGDPYQIDNPYVDSSSNGLSTIVEQFKGQPLAGHVTLVKGERSELAELAANIL
ncbi:MAG: PhoH family protein [Deltaproteobacteria bacterium]|nr:PhoH family protein [Deltaproteobacteria bacterium]